MKYAEVAVNSPQTQPRTFSYSIPPHIPISAGHAVWVPFGSRLAQGIVLAISDYPSVEETKEITQAIGSQPVLFRHQIELCRWIAEYYLSSYFDAAALMLPPGFERKVITFFQSASNLPEDAVSSLPIQQRNLLTILQARGKVELNELKELAGRDTIESIIGQLVREGFVIKSHELAKARVSPRLVKHLRLAVTAEQAKESLSRLERKRATKQVKLLELLLQNPEPISLPKARQLLGLTSKTVQTLIDQELISVEEVRVQRDPLSDRVFIPTSPLALTPAQEDAWLQIKASMVRLACGEPHHTASSVFLLHGVTGSGKTEIYMRALEQAILQGKRAIILVPEIALTPQTINRFAARFPNKVTVLHSKLSPGEQFDVWQQVRDGLFDVIIGSRGALFAPQPDLGLIVIDEEHEWTYKQHDASPHYHARDVALKLAELTNSVVILGSATPDVTSYYRAQNGEFQLLELPERISAGKISPLPSVEVVDLRRELQEGNRSIFSRSLTKSITETLSAREQVILFLNRRGTATFVQCRDCGFVLHCRRCDTPLTYHENEDMLLCHHCNYRVKTPRICPECGGKRIKFLGIGTQKVAEEASSAFPGARLLRWDHDVVRGKHSHERIMEQFLAHKADILIGTQMVAKGLDMPLVSVVGVINADIGLYIPHFRSSERTFQILAQVAGRAGRSKSRGKAIIQTYTPEHYAIVAAACHDYSTFYEQEIAFRHQQGNPPFNHLVHLVYSHTNAAVCQKEAARTYNILQQEIDFLGLLDTSLLGPSPAFSQRVRGKYRWQIIIRSPDPSPLLSRSNFPQGWSIDIDPVSLI